MQPSNWSPKSVIVDGVEYSYKRFTGESRCVPIWSDGTLDGSFVPKIIGHENHPTRCDVELDNGRVIIFDDFCVRDDGAVIVNTYFESVPVRTIMV